MHRSSGIYAERPKICRKPERKKRNQLLFLKMCGNAFYTNPSLIKECLIKPSWVRMHYRTHMDRSFTMGGGWRKNSKEWLHIMTPSSCSQNFPISYYDLPKSFCPLLIFFSNFEYQYWHFYRSIYIHIRNKQ